MADEGDLAQGAYDQFLDNVMKKRASERAQDQKVVTLCEECEERPTFITDKGTRTRICKTCWEDKKAVGKKKAV